MLLSTRPPATPAAPAPMATAGPLALPAALLRVPTTPLPFWLAPLARLAPCRSSACSGSGGARFAPLPLERAEPLLEREALLRLRADAGDLDRDEPPEEPLPRAPPERDDPLALVLEPEPLDEPALALCAA